MEKLIEWLKERRNEALKKASLANRNQMLYDGQIDAYSTTLYYINSHKILDGWLPIESAPRDGTRIMVLNGESKKNLYTESGDIGIAQWTKNGFSDAKAWISTFCCDGVTRFNPIKWQPLPKPPKPPKEGE